MSLQQVSGGGAGAVRRVAAFDLDGTLADTSADLIEGANRALAMAGAAGRLDPARDAGISGRGGRAMLRLGFERSGRAWSEADVDAAFDPFLAAYEAVIADRSRLFPGVAEALDMLAAEGWGLAVCTNKPERLARLLLTELSVMPRFAVLVGADTLPVRKPDPRPLWHCIDALGGDRGASVLVGDTRTDRETARAAGARSVLMDFGVSADRAAELEADAVLTAYADLAPTLGRLLPRGA